MPAESANTAPAQTEAGPHWISSTLPVAAAAWCCLVILQGKPTDIPPLDVLGQTMLIVGGTVAAIQLLLTRTRLQPAFRHLFLAVAVALIGLHGWTCQTLWPGLDRATQDTVWIVFAGTVLAALATQRRREWLPTLSAGLAFALLLSTTLQASRVLLPVASDRHRLPQLVQKLRAHSDLSTADDSVSPQASSQHADIYYIIVDAYARQDILSELYGHDNGPFLSQLRKRGFYVADRARSNYHLTELSLASSLNLQHLTDLELDKFQTRLPIRQILQNSQLASYLKSQGYQTIGFQSGKSDTECRNFDRFVSTRTGLDEYQDTLFHASALEPAWNALGLTTPARQHGSRVQQVLEQIPQTVRADDPPSFVFAHLLSPHPPFVFDELGTETEHYGYYLLADARAFTAPYQYDTRLYRHAYRSQLVYLNQLLLRTIDQIQQRERPAVIIVQGDHGPRLSYAGAPHEKAPDARQAARECFGILNAVCVPGDTQPGFYPEMTPINTLRLMVNNQFRPQPPLARVPDRCYFELEIRKSGESQFLDQTEPSAPPTIQLPPEALTVAP